MLNEIEETMQVFLNFSGDSSTPDEGRESSRINQQQLLSHWQTRLKMMQVSCLLFFITHHKIVCGGEGIMIVWLVIMVSCWMSVCMSISLSYIHPYFHFQIKTCVNFDGFSPTLVCCGDLVRNC